MLSPLPAPHPDPHRLVRWNKGAKQATGNPRSPFQTSYRQPSSSNRRPAGCRLSRPLSIPRHCHAHRNPLIRKISPPNEPSLLRMSRIKRFLLVSVLKTDFLTCFKVTIILILISRAHAHHERLQLASRISSLGCFYATCT